MSDASSQNSAGLITVAKAAALLMISDQWVRDLGKKGYVPKAVGGMVPLVAAVQGYIRWLKDEERRTSKSAAASQVQQERALEIRMRREREAGILIEMRTVETIFADVWGRVPIRARRRAGGGDPRSEAARRYRDEAQ